METRAVLRCPHRFGQILGVRKHGTRSTQSYRGAQLGSAAHDVASGRDPHSEIDLKHLFSASMELTAHAKASGCGGSRSSARQKQLNTAVAWLRMLSGKGAQLTWPEPAENCLALRFLSFMFDVIGCS